MCTPFPASWNYYQFIKCTEQLKTGEVILVHDFAQNYLCLLEDESTSKHWDHPQVMIHPSVAYYHCACGKVTAQEIVHISSDKRHDCLAVWAFQDTNVYTSL